MDLLSALNSVRIFQNKETLTPLTTVWGEELDPDHVLPEYPRPQMVRDPDRTYINLNGYWDYAIMKNTVDSFPVNYDGKILVPFSPEASLSGVSRQLRPDEVLFYQRTILCETLPSDGSHCILHFGAVDQYARVYLNGTLVTSHIGGYLPFSADITQQLHQGENILTVRVEDRSDTSYHSVGKQKLKRGGMFYTAQSGIWQTVWMEWVPEVYITKLKLTPDYDKETLHVSLQLNTPFHHTKDDNVVCYVIDAAGRKISKTYGTNHSDSLCNYDCYCDVDEMIPWTPENPYLYTLKIIAGKDEVTSYFAMRCFTIEKNDDEIPRFCLNHVPLFLNGVLDQGYWPDGLYTAPSDDALIYDIQTMKDLGFNFLRKHAKIEAARWYYHCDRLGMIVWQDMVNGGGYNAPVMTWLPTILPRFKTHFHDNFYPLLCRKNIRGREDFVKECIETVEHLSSFPCISTWVIFNEGWGQFHSKQLTRLFRDLDSQRLIDTASGWFDGGYGDFKSEHNYFNKQFVKPEAKRAFVISEYGGYACRIKGHVSSRREYGYKKCKTTTEFQHDYEHLMTVEIAPLVKMGLSGCVYTQVSDIEEETNGLLTYDRKVCKLKEL